MDIKKNLDYLFSFTRFGIKTGLGNIRRLCRELDNPQGKYPVIHIAGTNGKGTTCAMVSNILQKAGYRVGLYTSPHLVDFGERIRVDGEILSEVETAALVEELRGLFDSVGASFFEAATAMAFLHFARKKVEVAVVETGLGGSLDATNIVSPLICIFTPISLDHTDRLGKNIPAIAADKAGIIKYGCLTVSSFQQPQALEQIIGKAKSLDAEFHYAPEEILLGKCRVFPEGSNVEVNCGMHSSLSGIYDVPLPGRHQCWNLQTVLCAISLLQSVGFKITAEDIKSGVESVRWGGRLELIGRAPRIYYDVAHNPAAAEAVADFFREVFPGRRIHIVMGVVSDKDFRGILKHLAPIAADFTFSRLDNPRTLPPETLADVAVELGLPHRVVASAGEAIQSAALTASPDDIILIVGSHYLGAAVYRRNLLYSC